MGRQMNLIGIGVFNYAAIGYNKSLSDNLFADVALHAMKLSTLAMWIKHLVYRVNFLTPLIPE